MSTIVVHPSSRDGFRAERLRAAAALHGDERRKFLVEAIAQYRDWAASLGVPDQKINADASILGRAFFGALVRRTAP
jgi:hypothetical protein